MRQALELALEALEEFGEHYNWCHQFPTYASPEEYPPCNCGYDKAITAIKEALAQPEQEPVAWWIPKAEQFCLPSSDGTRPFAKAWEPLYTTPPQRKPLTDEMVVAAARVLNERQADACGVDRDDQWAIYSDDFKADARAMLEAAHGIKE